MAAFEKIIHAQHARKYPPAKPGALICEPHLLCFSVRRVSGQYRQPSSTDVEYGKGATEIAKELGIGRASIYRVQGRDE
jgi:hypothetical protein